MNAKEIKENNVIPLMISLMKSSIVSLNMFKNISRRIVILLY